MKEIQFDDAERKFASEWHGGQNTMLYAIASTGKLAIGSESFRRGRPDVVWLYDLVHVLINELIFDQVHLYGEFDQVHFYGEDHKVFSSMLAKLNMFMKDNRDFCEQWYDSEDGE